MNFNQKLIFDGGFGTALQQSGVSIPEVPEELNITHPELITSIHKRFVDAGSDLINANTFGANPFKAGKSKYSLEELIQAAIENARKAGSHVKVALDVGPLGTLLEPLGTLSFEDAYEAFSQIMKAGKNADFIMIETMTDLYEAKAAVLAAKENTNLPVICTMSFESSHRTFTGCTIPSMAMTLSSLGVDALGINCSVGPDQMADMIKELRQFTNLPIVCKPNAGLPDPITNLYDMDADTFALHMKNCAKNGAQIIGGCCGTSEEYIAKIKDIEVLPAQQKKLYSAVCSPAKYAVSSKVCPIGERINPTGKKRFQQALINQDMDYIISLALEQEEAGAAILDINVGYPQVDEEIMLPKVVKAVQSVCDLPLQLDSSNPNALKKALRIYNGKPSVNSFNGEAKSIESILPLVKKYGACVIGLTIDENGIPKTFEKRVEIARKLLEACSRYGIQKEDLWIDPLALTVSAQPEQAVETLKAISYIKKEMGLNCTLGVSNISFGLPNRPAINKTFLIQALTNGLLFPILNPNALGMMEAVDSFEVLNLMDPQAEKFIEKYAQAKKETRPAQSQDDKLSLEEAVYKGLKTKAAKICQRILDNKEMSELEIVENRLIPALDIVGKDYENSVLYLPQLLNAAQAAQSVFEILKDSMAKKGEASLSKGTIIMATVQGDVHDIGKNIVKTVLENYGYTLIDLGKDVAPQTILQAVIDYDVNLVGLSALMTTTLSSMEKTVQLIKSQRPACKIMVGGAVVTPEYAAKIGADYYSKDANDGVRIAKEVFSQ